jgi:hypothetical protein
MNYYTERQIMQLTLSATLSGSLQALAVVPPTDMQFREVLGAWFKATRLALGGDTESEDWTVQCVQAIRTTLLKERPGAAELIEQMDRVLEQMAIEGRRKSKLQGEWRPRNQ